MKHIKIRFGENIGTPPSEEKSFEDMFHAVNPMFCLSKRTWKPQMDIFETENEVVIQAEMAGVNKDDIIIEVNNKAVKITGTRNCVQHPDRAATYMLAEIQYGQFERVLYLPCAIDVEKVCAAFKNGFLEIFLGKLFRENIKSKPNISMEFIKKP
jgi:HSP20 family protein